MVSLLNELTITRPISDTENGNIQLSVPKGNKLHPGMSVAHFQLIRELGVGGFGTVFEAYDSRLQRHVALKIPNDSILTKRQAETFMREARAAAQIRDPNIVSVFEVGQTDNFVYIVSELIESETLTQWRLKEKRTVDDFAKIVCTLAHSVHKAHDADVIHRDLKPANILVDEANSPHIADFGLAIRSGSGAASIGRPGMIIGTPAYMSPEQARGETQQTNHQTDIFSLGVILYELLAGQRPYAGSDQESILDAICRGEYTPISQLCKGLHPDIDAICTQAMASLPEERYQTAEDLAEDLERFLARRPVSARPINTLERVRYFFGRNMIAAAIVLTGAGIVVWAIAAIILSGDRESLTAVEFRVNPPNAIVSLIPVDFDGIGLDESKVYKVTPDAEGRCTTDLPPTLYLLRIESDFCRQEVYRVVPSSPTEMRERGFLATEWVHNLSNGRITLQPIELKRLNETGTAATLGNLAITRVPKGRFNGGTESLLSYVNSRYQELFPVADYDMEEFFMARDEVSAADYLKVTGRRPRFMRSSQTSDQNLEPARGVTWLEAVDFAERVGGRLPTFLEYQYAATNAGTSRFPAGNLAPDSFPLESSLDLTKHQPPIRGLYSSLGEWIWDCKFVKFVRSESVMPNPLFQTSGPDSRLLVGLPRASLGPEIFMTETDDPSVVINQNRSVTIERIGFRFVYVGK